MPRPTSAELERVETEALVDICHVVPRGTDARSEVTRVGDATAFVLAGVPPLVGRRVVGLGVGAPAASHDVDAVLDWIARRSDDRYVVSLAPDARPARLYESLLARGFVPGYSWSKLHRAASAPVPEVKAPVEVRVAEGRRDAVAFADLAAETFGLEGGFAEVACALVGRPGWVLVLAFDGARAVGAGGLHRHGEDGWLGFGATAASHRGRGIHRAVLAARLEIARRTGLRTLAVETGVREPGRPDASFRNLLRVGFREAYVRPNLLSPALHRARVAESPAA